MGVWWGATTVASSDVDEGPISALFPRSFPLHHPPDHSVLDGALVSLDPLLTIASFGIGIVLLASALKLFNVSNTHIGIILILVALVAPVLWMLVRRRHGFPALASGIRRKVPT
jgi:hypothetical protein